MTVTPLHSDQIVGVDRTTRHIGIAMFFTLATVVMAFITLPTWVPRTIAVGGLTLQIYEVLLAFAALVWLLTGRKRKATDSTSAIALLLLAIGFGLSYLADMQISAIIFEARRLAVLALAVFVGGRAFDAISTRHIWVLSFTLWFSLALTLMASFSNLDLGQRSLSASLEYGDESAAIRIITDVTYPAVAVLTVCLCLYLMGRLRRTIWLLLLIPSVVLVLLSFSRNPLISLAAGVVVALCHSPSAALVARTLRLAAFAIVAFILMGVFAVVDQGGPAAQWLSSQTAGFTNRVLGGLSGDALATDNSARYRFEQELPYLEMAIWQSPIIGHGFGYEYKPTFTGRYYATTELAIQASRYAHNFYLWLMVKTGLIGLISFVLLAVIPALRALRRRTPHFITALAAALIGLMLQSFFAPMPIGNPTSLLFGALLGLVIAGVAESRTSRTG